MNQEKIEVGGNVVKNIEEPGFGEFDGKLYNELTNFLEESKKMTSNMLGIVKWLQTFDETVNSFEKQIKDIKGIKPEFVLSEKNKDKITEIKKFIGELEKVKQYIIKSGIIGKGELFSPEQANLK